MEVISNEEREDHRPRPNEFDIFVPWACRMLRVDATVIIVKVVRANYGSGVQSERAKVKGKNNNQILADIETKVVEEISVSDMQIKHDTTVKVLAYYDSSMNLIEIKFEKNNRVPRVLLKIIGLILPFHTHLNAVTIKKGLDKFVMYELKKFLPVSNITDICLDNTYFAEASYDILLESKNKLRQLSLARCGINDEVCRKIASKLVYSQPGSLFLSVLNLSSNRITDLGAKYLGDALRSNRKLNYLNLAGNMIGNVGAISILNSLQEFPIKSEELHAASCRNFIYLKKREKLLMELAKELRSSDIDKRATRKKSLKPSSVPLTKKVKCVEKDQSLRNINDAKTIINMEALWHEKAQAMADNVLGVFDDPFIGKNIDIRDSIVYCTGNNSLCYLNLAYNSLSYLSLKLLLNVLVEQKNMNRKPRGLLNVVIEGNCMPKYCTELTMIDQIIDHTLSSLDPKIIGKKKPSVKSKASSVGSVL